MEMQQSGDKEEPPAELTKTVRQVERRYSFVKTVHSLQELNDFGFENGCTNANVKNVNFKKVTFSCKTSKQCNKLAESADQPLRNDGNCEFTLLAWRPRTAAYGKDGIAVGETPAVVHVYAHGKHNHQLESIEVRTAQKLHRQLLPDSIAPVPSFIAPTDGRKWTFVETVEHLIHQLDKLKRKYHCDNGRLREMEKQKKQICTRTMRCANRQGCGCPFKLLIRNTDLRRSHLYTSGKHTCVHKKRVKKFEQISLSLTPSQIKAINRKNKKKQEKEQKCFEEPSPLLTRTYGNHQCVFGYIQRNLSSLQNVRLHCHKMQQSKCPFALMVWRPKLTMNSNKDLLILHVYATQNEHNHAVKPADERAMHIMPKHVVWSDVEQPPAKFNTPNGREWTFVETAQIPEEAEVFRKKFHCFIAARRKFEKQSKTTMFCGRGTCAFAVFAQKTDRGRYHLYRSGQHTCMHKEENVLTQYAVLPDAHPPASFATINCHRWTFLETMEADKEKTAETDLVALARAIGRKHHCHFSSMKQLGKRRFVCRMQLYCTTKGSPCGDCPFRLLAQKTDQGRFHLYVSGEHNCLDRERVKARRKNMKEKDKAEMEKEDQMQEEREDVMEKEEDKEDEIVDEEEKEEIDGNKETIMEEGGIDAEEGENDEVGKEGKDDEEEEMDENEVKAIEEEAETYTEEEVEEAENERNEEENEDEANEPLAMTNDEVEDEEEVEFLDFVDHPKSEGVKMRRLGQPKKEPGARMPLITMDEEEPIWRILKVPKQEVIKTEVSAEEDEPGPSNRGGHGQQQRLRATHAAAPPMAVINNRQNQQQQPMALARERWWAKEDRGVEKARNNDEQQRLLRERKRRVNYRE